MRRREFINLLTCLAAVPCAALAQPSPKVYRLGSLNPRYHWLERARSEKSYSTLWRNVATRSAKISHTMPAGRWEITPSWYSSWKR